MARTAKIQNLEGGGGAQSFLNQPDCSTSDELVCTRDGA